MITHYFKSNLRLIFISLIFLIVFSGVVTAVVVPQFENTEPNDAPVVYDSIKDFTGGTQTGPWYYEYATDSTNPTWNNSSYYSSWGYWYPPLNLGYGFIGMSAKATMWLFNSNGGIDELLPSIAYVFVAPEDGCIKIKNNKAYLSSDTNTENINGKVRITKNTENIAPAQGWYTISSEQSAVFENLSVNVSKGDKIRFEFTTETFIPQSKTLTALWNPALTFRKKENLYTKTNDIYNNLSDFMNTVFHNTESANFETGKDTQLAVAKESVKEGNNGIYSPLDAVYNKNKIVPSDEDSIWKFVSVPAGSSIWKTANADFGVSFTNENNSPYLKWESVPDTALYTIDIVDNVGNIRHATTTLNRISLSEIDNYSNCKYQVSADNKISYVYMFDNNQLVSCVINKFYLNDVNEFNYGIRLSNQNASGKFELYTSSNSIKYPTEVQNARTIKYLAEPDEEMRLGFKVPLEGVYEISVPAKSDKNSSKGFLITENADGKMTFVKEPDTLDDGYIYHGQLYLSKGDTIWFCAKFSETSTLDIGVPEIRHSEMLSNETESTFKYRAVDYFENNNDNKLSYNVNTLAAKKQSGWSFGYFSNYEKSEDNTENIDPLGLATAVVGDNQEQLLSALKPYELLRSGQFYNALVNSVKSDGTILTGLYGKIGIMSPIYGTSYADRYIYSPTYQCKGIMAGLGPGVGVYLQFSVPVSGRSNIALSDYSIAHIGTNMLILKNNTVLMSLKGTLAAGTSYDLGNLSVGDKITLCYYGTSNTVNYIGNPVISISSNWKKLELNNFIGSFVSDKRNDFTPVGNFILPKISKKVGKYLVGWNLDDENLYAPGESVNISENVTLTAKYADSGDINNDKKIDASDLLILRQYLLGNGTLSDCAADVNSDMSTDIRDLVRQKKYTVGMTVIMQEE